MTAPIPIQPGIVSVTENVPSSWDLVSSDCLINGVSQGTTLDFNVIPGNFVECIFQNTKISITRSLSDSATGSDTTPETATGSTVAGPFGIIRVSTSSGTISSLTAIDEDPPLSQIGRPADTTFPHGLLSWTVTGLTLGQIIMVDIEYPTPLPVGTGYWKVPVDWVDATSIIAGSGGDGDNIITLTIMDGGPFDGDLLQNGEITDPGGPAVAGLAPTVTTPIVSIDVLEDAADTLIDLTQRFDDVEDGAAGLTYSVTINNDPDLVTASITGFILTLSYVADANGDTTITVRGTDSALLFAQDTFTVMVEPQNDPPIAVLDIFIVSQDSGTIELPVLDNDLTLPDVGETLVITDINDITGFNSAACVFASGTISITAGNDAINYAPAPGFCGTEEFHYFINDGTEGSDDIVAVAIEVRETTLPVITLLGVTPVTGIFLNEPYVDLGATALDNLDGNITPDIQITGLPVDTSVVGLHLVEYDVADSAENEAITVTR